MHHDWDISPDAQEAVRDVQPSAWTDCLKLTKFSYFRFTFVYEENEPVLVPSSAWYNPSEPAAQSTTDMYPVLNVPPPILSQTPFSLVT